MHCNDMTHLSTRFLVEGHASALRGTKSTLCATLLVLLPRTIPEVFLFAMLHHLGHLGQSL